MIASTLASIRIPCWSVKDHIEMAQSTKASDLRDKVYALSSLYAAGTWTLKADYGKSLLQVWTDFAMMSVNDHHTLMSLPYSSLGNRMRGISSWAPRLDSLGAKTGFGERCNAFGSAESTQWPNLHEDTLIVYGLLLDHVDTCTLSGTEETKSAEVPEVGLDSDYARFCEDYEDVKGDDDTSSALVDIIFESTPIFQGLFAKLPSVRTLEEAALQTAPGVRILRRFVQDNRNFLLPNDRPLLWAFSSAEESDVMSAAPVIEFIGHYVWERRMTCTLHRRLGLVPEDAQKGDAICALAGLNHLGLLRRKDDGSGKWQWIGRCYVHGLMQGEGARARELDVQPFEIV